MTFSIYTMEDVLQWTDPEPLIAGARLWKETLIELYGEVGKGKSFVALDWVLTIAYGLPWNGKPVAQGDAVYLCTEGGLGALKKRVLAWRSRHQDEIKDKPCKFRVIAQPVGIPNKNQVDALIADLKAKSIKPALLVIDTLARNFSGQDENSTQHMNAFVSGCDSIKAAFAETKCSVLVVHHTPRIKKGENVRPRGAVALDGACDTQYGLMEFGKNKFLKCTKQKDGEEEKLNIEFKKEFYPGGDSLVVIRPDELDAEDEIAKNGKVALVMTLRGAGPNKLWDELRQLLLDGKYSGGFPMTPEQADNLKRNGTLKDLATEEDGRWTLRPKEEDDPAPAVDSRKRAA